MDGFTDKIKSFMLKPDSHEEEKRKAAAPDVPSEVDPATGYPPTKVPHIFEKYLPDGTVKDNIIAFYVWVDQQPQLNKAKFLFYASGFWFAFFFVILILHVVSHGGTRATGSSVSHDAIMPHHTTIIFSDLADTDDYMALTYLLKRPDVSVPLIVVPGGGGTGDVHGSQSVENLRNFLCRLQGEASDENDRMNAGPGEDGRNRQRKRLMPMIAFGSSISLNDRNYTYGVDMSPSDCATQGALWQLRQNGVQIGSPMDADKLFLNDRLRFLADSVFGVGQFLRGNVRDKLICPSNAEVIAQWRKAKKMEDYDIDDNDETHEEEDMEGGGIGRVPSAASLVKMVLEGQLRQAERYSKTTVDQRTAVSILVLGAATDLADVFYVPEDDVGDGAPSTLTALSSQATGATVGGRRRRQERIAAVRRARRVVSQVVVSGGLVGTGAGNVAAERFAAASSTAEINFFRDPEAARLLVEGRLGLPNVQLVHCGAVQPAFAAGGDNKWWHRLTSVLYEDSGKSQGRAKRRSSADISSLARRNLVQWLGLAAASQQSQQQQMPTSASSFLRPVDLLCAMIVSSQHIRIQTSVAQPSKPLTVSSYINPSFSPSTPPTNDTHQTQEDQDTTRLNLLKRVGVIGSRETAKNPNKAYRPHIITSVPMDVLWDEFFAITSLPWPV